MRLFVYGTLLGRLRGAEAARLDGWSRVGLRGTRYPTLRRCFRAVVAGEIATVGAAELRRLMAYEGPRYRLARVAVATAHGNTGAFAWISAERARRPWP